MQPSEALSFVPEAGGGAESPPSSSSSSCCCWKVCFSLSIPSLAKLGVFYTLTHFGLEKHKKKKKS